MELHAFEMVVDNSPEGLLSVLSRPAWQAPSFRSPAGVRYIKAMSLPASSTEQV